MLAYINIKGRLIQYETNIYEYDVDGRRIGKSVGTTKYTYKYEDNKLVKEIISDTTNEIYVILDFIYNQDNELIGVYNNHKTYYYDKNVIGEIIGIVDESGNYVVEYEYTTYGTVDKTITSTNDVSLYNPFVYKGYYYDEETELYWVSSRYYSPELCRWISPDSIEYLDPESINGLNLYAYCGNDPVNKYDPSGHSAILAILIAVGILVIDTIVETAILLNSDKYKAENVYHVNPSTSEGNVHIPNSAAFNNPIAQLIYSNYLYENVKNKDGSNFFTGDPYDIVGEWQAHNLAAILTGSLMVLDFIPLALLSNGDYFWSKLYNAHSSSVHTDIGPNINSEKRGIVRVVSKIYKWINKILSFDILNW